MTVGGVLVGNVCIPAKFLAASRRGGSPGWPVTCGPHAGDGSRWPSRY